MKWSWPNFKVVSRNLPRGTEENREIPLIGIAVLRVQF
jgi:hypothetical protein